jgi:WD40 repeat protein
LVVTGGPGSGKTAVLGVLAAVSDPEYRRTVPLASLGLNAGQLPPPKAIGTAVYAQNLTDQQVVRALAAALRLPPVESVADLLNQINAGPEPDRPRVVLIDGLDEAATPSALCSQVLRPLMELAGARLRLLLGTRRHLLAPLGLEGADHVDLDSPAYADPQAVLAYTVRNLIDAHPESPYLECANHVRLGVASAVAEAAGSSFLVARITAGTLAATSSLPDPWDADWRRSLPSAAADAMHRDLQLRFGEGAERILDLLRPLAYAEGQGLPWEDIWAPLASELSGRRYTNDDLRQLRRDAGAYVVEAVEDGRSVYRLYHEAMAEYLRQGQDAGRAHRAFTVTLRRAVPYRIDGARDWGRAHPYALRHLATHAARTGLLDGLVTEPEYLVHADADLLIPHLLAVESDAALLNTAIYRASIAVHRHLGPAERRQVLAVDAARYNEPAVLEAFNSAMPEGTFKPVAASGSLLAGNLRNAFASDTGATAVACAVLDGREVAVTGSFNGTVHIWDLITGQPVGPPMTGHTDSVEALACTTLNGRPIAVTGSDDATVRVWDLTTGRPVGPPMTGHTASVEALACTTLNGRPIAVTGSVDATVRVWDLTTAEPMGAIDVGGQVTALAVAVVGGRPAAITSSTGLRVRVWDLATCQELQGFQNEDGLFWVRAMACTDLDGQPVVVAWDFHGEVHVWNLETRRHLTSFPAHEDLYTMACTHLDGSTVVITSSRDSVVGVWDLKTGRQVGALQGHAGDVWSLACTSLAGRPVVVGGSSDAVRVWDLSVQRSFGRPVIGHTQPIRTSDCAVVKGRKVLVTGAADSTVRMWDAVTGLPAGEPLQSHTNDVWSVACITVKGRPVAVTASLDGTVGMWDMDPWQALGPRLTGPERAVSTVTCTDLRGRPVVIGYGVDHSVWVWEIETGKALYPPLRIREDLRAHAYTVLDDCPIAIIAHEESVQIWDLAARRPITEIPHRAWAVGCGSMGDRQVMVTGASDHSVRVWDLGTGQPVGQPMTGHSRGVYSVMCGVLDGRPVAVTCSADNTVRIWDLESCRAVDTVHVPRPSDALVLDASGRLAVTFGNDVAVFARQ